MHKSTHQSSDSQNSSHTPVKSLLQPRPFALQAQTEPTSGELDKPELQSDQQKFKGETYGLAGILMASNSGSPPKKLQPKLKIGKVGDRYEQEADRTASEVVRAINQPIQKKLQRKSETQFIQDQGNTAHQPQKPFIRPFKIKSQDEIVQQKQYLASQPRNSFIKPLRSRSQDQSVQRQEAIAGGTASADLESSIQGARGGGQSLDANLQQSMGQAMGADFSGVKVHTDSQSDQLNKSIQAKAFTTGQDVFFRQGAYEPSSRGGQELIAHELTHVVQQNGGAVQRTHNHQQKTTELAYKVNTQDLPSVIQRAGSSTPTQTPSSKEEKFKEDLKNAVTNLTEAAKQAKEIYSTTGDMIEPETIDFSKVEDPDYLGIFSDAKKAIKAARTIFADDDAQPSDKNTKFKLELKLKEAKNSLAQGLVGGLTKVAGLTALGNIFDTLASCQEVYKQANTFMKVNNAQRQVKAFSHSTLSDEDRKEYDAIQEFNTATRSKALKNVVSGAVNALGSALTNVPEPITVGIGQGLKLVVLIKDVGEKIYERGKKAKALGLSLADAFKPWVNMDEIHEEWLMTLPIDDRKAKLNDYERKTVDALLASRSNNGALKQLAQDVIVKALGAKKPDQLDFQNLETLADLFNLSKPALTVLTTSATTQNAPTPATPPAATPATPPAASPKPTPAAGPKPTPAAGPKPTPAAGPKPTPAPAPAPAPTDVKTYLATQLTEDSMLQLAELLSKKYGRLELGQVYDMEHYKIKWDLEAYNLSIFAQMDGFNVKTLHMAKDFNAIEGYTHVISTSENYILINWDVDVKYLQDLMYLDQEVAYLDTMLQPIKDHLIMSSQDSEKATYHLISERNMLLVFDMQLWTFLEMKDVTERRLIDIEKFLKPTPFELPYKGYEFRYYDDGSVRAIVYMDFNVF